MKSHDDLENQTNVHTGKSYQQGQEAAALLKVLSLGMQQIKQGKVQAASDVFAAIRNQDKNSY